MKKILSCLLAIAGFVCIVSPAVSRASELTLAGFAFAGDYKSAAQRFPHSFRIFERLGKAGPGQSLSARVLQRAREVSNPALDFAPAASLVNLKNSDKALMAVLSLSEEIVSTEDYGAYHKTFVNLRGDLLIFDYKAQLVVRSYPLSVVPFDATPRAPSEERLQGFVEDLLLREDGGGLITQFTRRLATASLPQEGSRTLQVRKAEVTPEALALMPAALRNNPRAAEALVADAFAAILSAKLGVPLLPNSIGHAVGGVMSLRLENGDDMKLKLGEGDYLFDLRLNRFAKIKTSETKVGTAYVYGAYTSLRFYEPSLGTEFIKTDLKNGESAVVPSSQVAADDFPAYQDAIRGLFLKFSDALQQPDSSWINTAASAKDIGSQLATARDILRKCK